MKKLKVAVYAICKNEEKFVDIQVEVLGNTVPLLNRIKDKYKRKLEEFDTLDNNIKYNIINKKLN